MATIISFANQKGGVAKTTSTFNTATCLVKRGYKVLMIDLDPQASLTIYAGLEPYEHEKTIVDILKNPRQDIKECIVQIRDTLDIITSRIELAGVENELLGRTARELTLSRALNKVQENYDYIIIDCPPQLSTLTVNALACSDKVIIPCKTDYLAYRGIKQLLETVEVVRSYFKSDLEVLGLLATLYESRAKDDNEILDLLKEEYNVLAVIKRTTEAKKGMYDGLSSVEASPNSSLAKEYEKLVDLILK